MKDVSKVPVVCVPQTLREHIFYQVAKVSAKRVTNHTTPHECIAQHPLMHFQFFCVIANADF